MCISKVKLFNNTSLPANKENKPLKQYFKSYQIPEILPEKNNFIHQNLCFSGLSPVAQNEKKIVSCTETLHEAWKDPKARSLIENSIKGVNFKYNPDLADKFIEKIDELCSKNNSCEKIYSDLRVYFKEIKPKIKEGLAREKTEKVNKRVNIVKEMLGDIRPETVIDIGCGDGMTTQSLKNGLNLANENVIGLDVCVYSNNNLDFPIKKFDGKNIPVKDESQDLALLFLVLHHVKNPLEYLKEIHRTLKSNGHLIVKEFDAPTKSDKLFNIVIDELWYKVYTPCDNIPLSNNFHRRDFWKKTFEDAGFKIDKFLKNDPNSPCPAFMAMLSKK